MSRAVPAQARRDVEQGLSVTLAHFRTRAQQERALTILQFKLDILWAMNDAMAQRYGIPLTSADNRRAVAEEVLAHLAQTNPQLGEIFAQTRDEDLAAQDHQRRQ